jgi:hypothetical protein
MPIPGKTTPLISTARPTSQPSRPEAGSSARRGKNIASYHGYCTMPPRTTAIAQIAIGRIHRRSAWPGGIRQARMPPTIPTAATETAT